MHHTDRFRATQADEIFRFCSTDEVLLSSRHRFNPSSRVSRNLVSDLVDLFGVIAAVGSISSTAAASGSLSSAVGDGRGTVRGLGGGGRNGLGEGMPLAIVCVWRARAGGGQRSTSSVVASRMRVSPYFDVVVHHRSIAVVVHHKQQTTTMRFANCQCLSRGRGSTSGTSSRTATC